VVFEIADDGIGMRPEIRDRIFDLFYSSKGQAGTGLGLFIARQVIQQHGGRIEVESAPGQGTRFRVRLPRVLPDSEKARNADLQR
jgi:signal transduction histidine kinase